jgi:hypothetical protein
MDNFLRNGAVLPHGLLGNNPDVKMAGFNKTYRNFPLRVGVIVKTYPVGDSENVSDLTTEYDVIVFEQHEDKGATAILYRNCMSGEGLGSIADFFEKNLRHMTAKSNKGDSVNMQDQNGAVVLILCLDAMSDKAVIIGAITHPQRKTTLTSDAPHLEGEYNGVHIVVNEDGSTSLTFKGATDNDGKLTDPTQGNTVISIEKDGSMQTQHKTITQRLDKNGKASLTADDDISNTTKTNFNVTATKDIDLTATGDMNAQMNNLVMKAQGSATLDCSKLSITAQSDIGIQGSQIQIQAQSLANIKASTIVLDGQVSLGGQGGQPVLLMTTMMLGIGNAGLPVLSQAISGYATKVTAQ